MKTKSDRTSLSSREKYQLESQRIQQEIGGLSEILQRLGLNQRRACQLLLVDPSAWTRWNKTGAPPHIYQALYWLLELKKTNSAITGPVDLGQRLDKIQLSTQEKFKDLEQGLAMVERALALTPATAEPSPGSAALQLAILDERREHLRVIAELEDKVRNLTAASVQKASKLKTPSKKVKAVKRRLQMKRKKKTRMSKVKRGRLTKTRKKKTRKPKVFKAKRIKNAQVKVKKAAGKLARQKTLRKKGELKNPELAPYAALGGGGLSRSL